MKEDKIIKWLILAVVVMAMFLLGLLMITRGWVAIIQEKFDTREKYVTAPGTPAIVQEKVSMDTEYFAKGLLKYIDANKIRITAGKGVNIVEWKINSETKTSCIVDTITNPSGQIERASNSYIVYGKEMAQLPNGNDVDWLISQVTIDQPVIVFGDKNEMTAKAIYFYADKCL